MRTKTIEVSEYVYDRLETQSNLNNLKFSDLIEIGLELYLDKKLHEWRKSKNYPKIVLRKLMGWDDFLDHTSALLQFYLHHAEVTFNEDSIKIYVDNSFAYDGIKQDMSKLKESLKSFYKKDLDVTLFLEYHD